MPTPSTEQAVTVKGRVVKPYEVLSEMPPHRLGWVASADDGTYLCHDGQFLPKSLGTWPSMEACERFIREHQDPPASPPASEGAKELPDAPGVWTRNGRTLVVREMLDDPGTWRLRGFDANTGVEVEISEQWSPLKGGWRPASASPAGEHKDREEVERLRREIGYGNIEAAIKAQAARLAALEAENARLREFCRDAHAKLDSAGIPDFPEQTNRMERRLFWMINELGTRATRLAAACGLPEKWRDEAKNAEGWLLSSAVHTRLRSADELEAAMKEKA